jgi:Fur family transcriptional regulator, ferric uptake regulator
MKRAKATKFRNFIMQKGLKSTRQRDIILEAFLASDRHLSIEELCQQVRQEHPNIGYATVYRTLKLFAESGIAREIQFGDGQTRYEHADEGEHHDHLICTRCGAITEFHNDVVEAIQDEIAASHGFVIKYHKMELYGHCPRCKG